MRIDYETHESLRLLNSIKNRLEQPDSSDLEPYDKEYILSVLDYFELRLNSTNPVLINKQMLDPFISILSEVHRELNNYFANKSNYGHINNAKNHLTRLIITVNQNIPVIISSKASLTKIITNFRNAVKEEFNSFKVDINELNSNLNDIKQDIKSFYNQLNELNHKVEMLDEEIQTEMEKFKTNLMNSFMEEKNKIENITKEITEKLNIKLNEAKKIVNLVGDIGVTGNYQKIANYHKNEANKWRYIALGIMIIAIFYLGYVLLNINSYDWHLSFLRILATAIFIYPAQYAASQSNKHRQQEFLNRKMELDLAAINPFIEILDNQKKQEIKEKLVEKYFSFQNDKENQKTDDIPVTLLEKIGEIFGKFLKQ